MPFVEFVGQSRKAGARSDADPSRLVNLYREPSAGTHAGHVLKSVLGTMPFADTESVFVRAMREIDGILFAVAGASLFQIDALGTASLLGEVSDDPETTISGNNGSVCVTASGRYWVWSGGALTEVDMTSEETTSAFESAGSAFFLGNRQYLTERGGRKVQWSDLAAPETLNALSFATTESNDDLNVRGIAISGNAWLFKDASIEVWTETGDETVVTPIQTLDVGLKDFGLLCQFPNGAFFVGSDGVAYITSGGGLLPVSTAAVETAISSADATRCLFYEDNGHKMCCIRFRDRPAWCYDIATGEWHERAYGGGHDPWPAVATAKAFGRWFLATDLGPVHEMARVNADVGVPMLRRAVSRTLVNGGDRVTIRHLEVIGNQGAGSALSLDPRFLEVEADTLLDTDGGEVPLVVSYDTAQADVRCWLRVSKDRGNTWGRIKTRSLGKLGEYAKRTIWRNLGQGRQFNVEFNMADPVEAPIFSNMKVVVE